MISRGVNKRIWGGAIAAVILLIVFVFRGPLSYAGVYVGSKIAVPIWEIEKLFSSSSKDIDLNMRALSIRIDKLEQENARLTRELGRTTNSKRHLALVLSSIRSSPFDTFIIDQGSADGVAQGSSVESEEGVLLGEVMEVYPHISKVELYSAFGKEFEVELDQTTRVIASGQGSQNFFLKLPQGLSVYASSTLSLPGRPDMILAVVEHIETTPGEAFQKVYARSLANINSLQRVYVISE